MQPSQQLARAVAKLMIGPGMQLANKYGCKVYELDISPFRFREVADLIEARQIAFGSAAQLLESFRGEETVDDPAEEAARRLGLLLTGTVEEVDVAVKALLATNPKPLQDLRDGKQQAIGALVGIVMKTTKGMDAKVVRERIMELK